MSFPLLIPCCSSLWYSRTAYPTLTFTYCYPSPQSYATTLLSSSLLSLTATPLNMQTLLLSFHYLLSITAAPESTRPLTVPRSLSIPSNSSADPRDRNELEQCCHLRPEQKNPYCMEFHIPPHDPFYRLFGFKCIDFIRGFPGVPQNCALGELIN